LPFDISGTTDVLIVKKSHINARDIRTGIQAGFELKKKVQDSHTHQAIGQLFVANIFSQEPVFVVLTDLGDEWIFYWLNEIENNIKIMELSVGLKVAIHIVESTFGGDSPLSLRDLSWLSKTCAYK